MLVFYLHVCMCSTCVSIAWGGQKGIRFPRTAVTEMVWTTVWVECRCSQRAASALTASTKSPVLIFMFVIH